MKKRQNFIIRHAKSILAVGLILLIGAGAYGVGLFNILSDDSESFYATGTSSETVDKKVKEVFGGNDDEKSIVLLEAKDEYADVTKNEYAKESYEIFSELKTTSVFNYYYTHDEQFLSRNKNATYAVVTVEGNKDEQYQKLTDFSKNTKSDLFNISVGGVAVGQRQTMDQVKDDLILAEMISLPILAVLLFFVFRSPIAAALPLGMSVLTIAGALALSRLISLFMPIDTYTLNVVTILSVGLSVDYSLLAVNRFRDELHGGASPEDAAATTTRTAGRTVLFSGLTVAFCLLSLMFFPVGFMHSIAVGGVAAVLAAVLITIFLLPAALRLIGKNIDRWALKRKHEHSKGWEAIAKLATKRPVLSILFGVVVIAALVWPVGSFANRNYDWHILPSNQSSYHVGKVMSEQFDAKSPSLTVLAEFKYKPSIVELCQLAESVGKVDGVEKVQGAYSTVKTMINGECSDATMRLAGVENDSPQVVTMLKEYAAQYSEGNYARVEVTSSYDTEDSKNKELMSRLQDASTDDVKLSVGGLAARFSDTLDSYMYWLPYVFATIVLAMLVILSISLGSVVIPLQSIIINSLALLISLGVLVMIFQYGWLTELLNLNATGGFVLAIPILIFVIAFGLSMDYAVFLYSRMHEIYDHTGDSTKAIVEGVVKTGPVITAAALLMVTVVAAFAISRIAIIQQIGIGLAVAVLVDAFFVRIVFVPAVMKLFGETSWWGPKWLKKITVRHE